MLDLLASKDRLRSAIAARRHRALKPPPQIHADEWADRFRIVPTETSAVTGRWDTSLYEVARGPMRAITEPGVRIISGMASAQIFKTSTIETALGFFMHLKPRPLLVYEPTDTTVAAFVDSKLDPMIRSTPELASLWGGRKALEKKRDDFTASKKQFPGGYVEILTANSPANTASRAAGLACMDEVDKFEMTRDGDPVALIDERLKSFSGEELSIRMSTPTIEGESPIAAEYAKSDRRKPFLECPHCGEWHYLKWSQVHYKDEAGKPDPDAACYVCESCGVAWTEAERIKPLTTKNAISWRQTRPFRCCDERQDPESDRLWDDEGRALCKHCGRRAVSNRHAGFWAWEAYHPRRSLADLVRSWLDCQGNRGKLQNFINSKLAETWKPQEEQSLAVDLDQFSARTEPAWDAVPAAVRVLTVGVDVQPRGPQSPGRLEAEVVGWGDGEETWSVEYHVIEGDPDEPEVWSALDEIRLRAYPTEDGRSLHVQAVCVDTGGHNLDAVMSYCGSRRNSRVWAVKGASELGGKRQPIWPVSPPKTVKNGARLYIVGTLAAKDWVASCISKTSSGPGFMHVPADRFAAWFEQLLNEKRVSFQANGRTMTTWKPRASGARTEALDCRVYAKAALEGLKRLGVRLGVSSAAATAAPAPQAAQPTSHPDAPRPQPAPPPPVKKRPIQRPRSSFWG